jgi:hypothetical protein
MRTSSVGKCVLLACVAAAVGGQFGCATKRYGRQTELSDVEKTQLTCRELDIEIAKVRAFQDQVNKDGFDGRDVLGILGDFGIGNSMERGDALKSAERRLQQLQDLRQAKNCP